MTAFLRISPSVQHGAHLLRETVARQLTSRVIKERGPRYKHTMLVEGLRISEVAHGVLKHLAGECGQKLQRFTGKSSKCTSLQVQQLDGCSAFCGLHIVRPKHGAGCLRIKCGSASYEDMLMGVEAEATYIEPPVCDGSFSGYKFEVTITTVCFNGMSGCPRWPAAPYPTDEAPDVEDERYSTAEQGAIVLHAKNELEQKWSTAFVSHNLIKKGWTKLPAEKWQLAGAVVNPGPSGSQKRQRSGTVGRVASLYELV
jgi:hypothetical protein